MTITTQRDDVINNLIKQPLDDVIESWNRQQSGQNYKKMFGHTSNS